MNKGALSSSLTVIARGWTQVTAVALLLLAGRHLDLTTFGEFTVASALSLMLTQWVGVGCYERVLSTHADRAAMDTAFLINTLSSLAMALIGVAMGFVAKQIYGSWTIASMVWLLSPLALFAGWRSAAEAAMLGEGKLFNFAVSAIVVETMALVIGGFALVAGKGVYALVAAKYIQLAFGGPIMLIFAGRLPRLRFDRSEAGAIWRLWKSLIVDRVLSYFQNYSADLLLGALLSPAAAAIYRISLRLVSLVGIVISDPLRSLGWTVLAKAQKSGTGIARDSEMMIGLVFILLSGPLALIALTGGDLAVLALGSQWAQAAPVIALMAAASVVMIPTQVSEAAFGVAGEVRQLPRQRVVFVTIGIVAMIVAAPHGPEWTAASQLLASLICIVVALGAQRRYLGLYVRGYRGIALRALAAATAATVVAGLLGSSPLFTASVFKAPLQACVGILAYGLLVMSSGAMRGTLLAFSRAVAQPPSMQNLEMPNTGSSMAVTHAD